MRLASVQPTAMEAALFDSTRVSFAFMRFFERCTRSEFLCGPRFFEWSVRGEITGESSRLVEIVNGGHRRMVGDMRPFITARG